jgi:hypothetical protein
MNEEYPPGFAPPSPEEDTKATPTPPSTWGKLFVPPSPEERTKLALTPLLTDLPKPKRSSTKKAAKEVDVNKLPKSPEKSVEPTPNLLASKESLPEFPASPAPAIAPPPPPPLVSQPHTLPAAPQSLQNLRNEYRQLKQLLEKAEIQKLHEQCARLEQLEVEKRVVMGDIREIQRNIVELRGGRDEK